MVTCTESRLAGIPTSWTLVMRAHMNEGQLASSARFQILDRYGDPVWRYLLGITRDETLAEDLFQEFVVRFLGGNFRRVSPDKGRFRDYLKTVLINLMKDHFRSRSDSIALHDELIAEPPTDDNVQDGFDERWRQELLRRTWLQLKHLHPLMHDVLQTHVNDPEASASEKADQIGKHLSTSFTANRFRVNLHRARQKFATILEKSVAATLDAPSEDQIRDELRQLRLLRYCRGSLSAASG